MKVWIVADLTLDGVIVPMTEKQPIEVYAEDAQVEAERRADHLGVACWAQEVRDPQDGDDE